MLFGTAAPFVAPESSGASELRSSLKSAALCFESIAPVPPKAILPPGTLEPPPVIPSVKSNLTLEAAADFVAADSMGDDPAREPSATLAATPADTRANVARRRVNLRTRMSVLPFL